MDYYAHQDLINYCNNLTGDPDRNWTLEEMRTFFEDRGLELPGIIWELNADIMEVIRGGHRLIRYFSPVHLKIRIQDRESHANLTQMARALPLVIEMRRVIFDCSPTMRYGLLDTVLAATPQYMDTAATLNRHINVYWQIAPGRMVSWPDLQRRSSRAPTLRAYQR